MVEYQQFRSLMEHVGHELATRSATCLDGLPEALLAKFGPSEKRQNYLLMQEVIADLPLRERAELGKQFARVVHHLSEQQQGYAQATAHVDSRPDWVFVFGASKGWARAGMLSAMEQTMRAALAYYRKQRCMIIIARDQTELTLPAENGLTLASLICKVSVPSGHELWSPLRAILAASDNSVLISLRVFGSEGITYENRVYHY